MFFVFSCFVDFFRLICGFYSLVLFYFWRNISDSFKLVFVWCCLLYGRFWLACIEEVSLSLICADLSLTGSDWLVFWFVFEWYHNCVWFIFQVQTVTWWIPVNEINTWLSKCLDFLRNFRVLIEWFLATRWHLPTFNILHSLLMFMPCSFCIVGMCILTSCK